MKINLSLQSRILFLMGSFILLLGIIGFVAWKSHEEYKVTGSVYQHIVESKDLVADILPPPEYIIEAYLTTLQMAGTTADTEELQSLQNKFSDLKKDYLTRHEYWNRLSDGPIKNLILVAAYQPAMRFFNIAETQFIPAVVKGDQKQAQQILTGNLRQAYVEHRRAIDELVKLSNEAQARAESSAEEGLKKSSSTVMGITLVLVLAFIATAYLVTLKFSKQVHQIIRDLVVEAEQSTTASTHVSQASHSVAEGASEQAASVEETSASLEEISSMTKRNTENAKTAKENYETMHVIAEQNAKDMQDMTQAMSEISKIVKSIDEIAFQTNILALNAAVEAARAGEAGLGFAVVADEVRSLAQRSAASARETANRIKQGVSFSDKVNTGMSQMLQKVNEVNVLIQEIATASQEQEAGLSQINIAISQIDRVTQANAASAEETASASEEVCAQAQQTKRSIDELSMLVEGHHATGMTFSQKTITPPSKPTQSSPPVSSAQIATPAPTTVVPQVKPPAPALKPKQLANQGQSVVTSKSIPMDGDFRDF